MRDTFDIDINYPGLEREPLLADVTGRVVFLYSHDAGDHATPETLNVEIADVEVLVQLYDDDLHSDEPFVYLECPDPDNLERLIGKRRFTALMEQATEEAESRVRGE